jgi:hypothetical protein
MKRNTMPISPSTSTRTVRHMPLKQTEPPTFPSTPGPAAWSPGKRLKQQPPARPTTDAFEAKRPVKPSPYEHFQPTAIRVNREGIVLVGNLNRSVTSEIHLDTLNRTASVRETKLSGAGKDRTLTKRELAALKRNLDRHLKAGDQRPELRSARQALDHVR